MLHKTLALLLGVALAVATAPLLRAQPAPAAPHHAAHHDVQHESQAAEHHHDGAPCETPCDCKGPLTAHCCAQTTPALAQDAPDQPAPAFLTARSPSPRAADEETRSLHPPTPPPKLGLV